MVDLRADGLIAREECAKRLSAEHQELRTAGVAVALTPAPAIDLEALARGLAGRLAFSLPCPSSKSGNYCAAPFGISSLTAEPFPLLGCAAAFLAEILASDTA